MYFKKKFYSFIFSFLNIRSPKEKKHKRPNDRKNEKDDDKMKMEIENSNLAYEKKEMGEIRSEDM